MRTDDKYLQDMLNAIAAIESYKTLTYEDFAKDEKTQDAIMFNLVIMGEAANRISEEFQEQHIEIPWASIIGTRNVIVHGYDQIKLLIVWDIIQKNLDSLKKNLLKLI